MPDTSKPKRTLSKKATFGALITGLVLCGSMFAKTSSTEEPAPVSVARINAIGVPTICVNHTKDVKMGDTATMAECAEFARYDYAKATTDAVSTTPTITDHPGALQATADFISYAGVDAYAVSPMRYYFERGEWTKGCQAFIGYRTRFLYQTRKNGELCFQTPDKNWVCAISTVINRRQNEADICLNSKETQDVRKARP